MPRPLVHRARLNLGKLHPGKLRPNLRPPTPVLYPLNLRP